MIQRSLASRLFYSFCWYNCWVFTRLMFRFRWTGSENFPKTGPVLLVSNHQSYLDPVLLGVACPRQLRALARRSLFFWPLGWVIGLLGAVPIDRQGWRGGIKTTLQLLKLGEAVLVFPEGTRTANGELQPFFSGFCILARRSGATIVPVAIDGAFAAMPRGSRFPRPRRITLVFGQPIASERTDQLADAELAELVNAQIAGMLLSKDRREATVQNVPPC
jgi:1-acyl-sn-glycerol-3-phosphate acyltransferase